MKQTDVGIEVGGVPIFGNFLKVNPFSRFFNKNRGHDNALNNERVFNSQGLSQEELMFGSFNNKDEDQYVDGGGVSTIQIQFDQYFATKSARINQYRSMAKYPEICDAIDMIVNEAIVEDVKGNIVSLELKKEVPEHIEEEMRKIWEYLINEVFEICENGVGLFRRFMIDGELFLELILNEEGNNIIGVKALPAFTMYPIYRENQIIAYVQSIHPYSISNIAYNSNINYSDEDIVFDRDQVVYVSYSDEIGANRYETFGFLDSSIRIYNQLRQLEDATVVNKIVRAPMRRVFNIATGRMNKTRGEEYVRGLMHRLKKRVKYDSETGAMDSSENFLSMTEDYWFPKPAGEEGTTVTNLEGSDTFDDMTSVNFFLKKLYKTLKLPSSRWSTIDTPSVMSSGKNNEITREELKFSRFIEQMQNRFKYILLDSFITLLRLRGFDDRYIDYRLFNVRFTSTNSYKMFRDIELLSDRLNVLNTVQPYMFDANDNPGGMFDKEYALKKMFFMTDEEFNENLYMLNKSKNKIEQGAIQQKKPAEQVGMGVEGGAGGVEAGGGPEMGAEMGGGGGGGAEEIGPPPEELSAQEIMGGTEETGGAESFNFAIKKTKPTSILVEFVHTDKIIDNKFHKNNKY